MVQGIKCDHGVEFPFCEKCKARSKVKYEKLMEFLEMLTDCDVKFRPLLIELPEKDHEQFRQFWRNARGGLWKIREGWFNWVKIELSNKVKDVTVHYDLEAKED